MTDNAYLKCLQPPTMCVDAVLDTDAYNEIDDQFALAYMIRSSDRINVKAIYAAPFFNSNSTSPADGMEKSYDEILNLLDLMDESDLKNVVFKGSDRYLENEIKHVMSDAASDLAKRAMEYSQDNPLYVVAIGAITNVASALLLNPQIKDRIVIVWLGGHSYAWDNTREFNMYQDVAAARVIFESGAPVVQFPCMGVVSAFTLSGDDMRQRLYGKNALCNYLVMHTEEAVSAYVPNGLAWSRVIWDVTAVSWLTSVVDSKTRFFEYKHVPAPICGYDNKYTFDDSRQKIAYIYYIKRDQLFRDLIDKLTK